MDYSRPEFLISKQIAKSNIRAMAAKAAYYGLHFRPHFKTHQSAEVGEWFREAGVRAITVSSVSMARQFAEAGWDDITIAFPMNIREVDEICALAGKVRLNLLFDMPEQAAALAASLKHPAGYFIKVDVGYHRAGVLPDGHTTIEQIIQSTAGRLAFRGFITHTGHTYRAKSREEVIGLAEKSNAILAELKRKYQGRFPGIITSSGDTPSCSICTDFSGIDEIRPGNFVYYDLMQLRIGSCSYEQIAAAVICPVVSVYRERNQALIYGGAVHLSKESLTDPRAGRIFGLAVPFNGKEWMLPEGEDYLVSLSQEHGILRLGSKWAASLRPGDPVAVIPVHSCLAANLLK